MEQLPSRRNSRVLELMMEADGRRYNQEQRERHPRERLGKELSAGLTWKQRVPYHVRGEEPEVHQRVTEVPEQRARKDRVNRLHQSKRPGNELKQHLGGDANRRQKPEEG